MFSRVVHYTARFQPGPAQPDGVATARAGGQSLVDLYRPRRVVELTLVGHSRSGKQIHHADQQKKRCRHAAYRPGRRDTDVIDCVAGGGVSAVGLGLDPPNSNVGRRFQDGEVL